MRLTEDEWAQLTLRERARKVIGFKLSGWLQELEARYYEKVT
jgi:hypothetical protein